MSRAVHNLEEGRAKVLFLKTGKAGTVELPVIFV